ncbi:MULTISPECIES: hypothetical protein [Comamonas]|uniref:hypothetical protein n=1 Tax=Comamonas TaxID=283 RepID=UPI0012C2A3AD|nr:MULTISPECIES: hypothetical protein [Comamonas]MPT13096.1 hypothetical protein [Comamonas sp.]
MQEFVSKITQTARVRIFRLELAILFIPFLYQRNQESIPFPSSLFPLELTQSGEISPTPTVKSSSNTSRRITAEIEKGPLT